MSGVGNDLFDPDGHDDARHACLDPLPYGREPDVSELPETPFEDVEPDAWYAGRGALG